MQNKRLNSPLYQLSLEEKSLLFSYFPYGIVALDLETTGLSPLVDRIVEIGAIKITPSKFEIFESFINPEIPIPAHTTSIHGITDEMVQNAPKIIEGLNLFNIFLGDLPIVAHNAKFDLGFVVMSLQKHKLSVSKSDVYCSCKLARVTFKEFKNHKLSTLSENLNITLDNHHRAFDDAFASLKIFIESLKKTKPFHLERQAYLFSLKDFDPNKKEELPEHLKSLEILVKQAAVIEIKYAGGQVKNTFRPIKLTSLLNTPDGNMLYGRCLIANIYKTFKISKISEIRKPSSEQISDWLAKAPERN